MIGKLFWIASILLVFPRAESNNPPEVSNGDIKHKHGRNFDKQREQIEHIKHLEKLGELFYQNQKVERKSTWQWAADLNALNGNFPCIRGTTPIGLESPESIKDGHKFGCGINFISGPPIVYSFGSNRQQDFETAMKQLRPDSSIFTFEIEADLLPAIEEREPGVQFFNIGLGYSKDSPVLKSFSEIMTMLNHSYVDVVKMDIEGYEWHWIHKEPESLDRVGQLLMEIHVKGLNEKDYPGESAVQLVEMVEARGLRLFHKEINHQYPNVGAEFSFIQRNWEDWDEGKKALNLMK